jgi:hypothetical protein
VWATPRAESVLRGGGRVRVAWIDGRPQAEQDQAGVQVGLVEGIHVDILPQVTAVPDVASLGVKLIRAGRCSVLDGAPGLEGGQIVKVRHDRLLALADGQ